MRTRGFKLLLAAVILIACRLTTFAHHSLSAEFDGSRQMAITGTITKVEWMNPHTFFYVDAKDPKTGATLNWACELGSPNALLARGWKPSTLKVGMTVSLTGTLARDGSRKVNARNIVADGNRLSAWASEQVSP